MKTFEQFISVDALNEQLYDAFVQKEGDGKHHVAVRHKEFGGKYIPELHKTFDDEEQAHSYARYVKTRRAGFELHKTTP